LGCGLGETVVALSELGFEAHGVEESKAAICFLTAAYPRAMWHQMSVARYLETADSFDVITLYHVLEHIPQPQRIVRLLAQSLRPNGLLVIEVPDVSGGQARLKRWRWQYWLPHHVNYFAPHTLRRLLEPAGFHLESVERKYHLQFPQGIKWRDGAHSLLARLGFHDIITTYWQRVGARDLPR
jgi:2-polyprenyl-3-methyl-5-hydroxy-6-metoxy-1,4-benzoquinol methylase